MAASRFFCFPMQIDFAEKKKWPTNGRWQGGVVDRAGGYMRRAVVASDWAADRGPRGGAWSL